MSDKVLFEDLCQQLNLDIQTQTAAYTQFKEIQRNTILEGNPKHWACCAIYTACSKSMVPTVGHTYMQGNGVSLVKLINACDLSIYLFFEKIAVWFKVASVPNIMQQKIENLTRSFQVSQLIYQDFSTKFAILFQCPEVEETKKTTSRKKSKNIPYTSQKLFEVCWCLFVCVKGEYPEKAADLVTSINLLVSCFEFIFTNVLHDNRRDLMNRSFPGLPKGFFSPSFDESKASSISIIDKLCDNPVDVMQVKNSRWDPVIQKFFNENVLKGDSQSIISVENFDTNFKKLNDLYETYILSCGQFDERIFLYHADIGSKSYGKSNAANGHSSNLNAGLNTGGFADNLNNQAMIQNSHNLMPSTPLSGQDCLHQQTNKLSPISSCRQNVQKLQALFNGTRGPQSSLKDLLCVCPDSILDSLNQRLVEMQEIFCTKLMAKGQDRFQYAEALYYRLLESIIRSELKTHGRFDLFINDDLFNQTLIVLCLEIVLFAFSLHKELPVLLECFKLEPFHFSKLIEVAIRNNKDYFTNEIIKHLKAIEEQCLDSLAWTSDSILWEMIKENPGKLPTNQDVDLQPSSSSQNNSPNNVAATANNATQSPKSLKLFFRKFYQLSHLRMKDLCKNLQFSNNSELLRKIWTLFEFAIIEHTDLMKDRHLDQILMCCVYVLCKIRSNENRHTFADIMKFYRNQPQSDSHIYRSVFIEYIRDEVAVAVAKQLQQNGNDAVEPEVVSGRNTIYGTESRGDIICFYNKVFVPKMQTFAMRFSTSASQNNLLLSPLPHARPLISPRKISPFHDVYVQPLTKQNVISPSARTLTFTIEQSPSKDLQKINSLINQSKKLSVAKRFNIDDEPYQSPRKISKDTTSSLKLLKTLISDREEVNN